MLEKNKGDLDFLYTKGFFQDVVGFEPFQVYRVYDCEVNAEKTLFAPLTSVSMCLLYCMSGNGVLRTDKTSYPIAAETLVFCPLSAMRSALVIAKGTQLLRYVVIEFAVLSRSASSHLSSVCTYYLQHNDVQIAENMSVFRPFMSHVISELCAPNTVVSVVKGAVTQALVVAYRGLNCSNADYMISETSVHAVGHTVYAIIRYIDDHLYSMNHLMGMAKDLGYSYNYLSHLFRRKTGMTIQAYVSRKKIEKSLELLNESSLSITEIAAKLNYDCIQSFSKAFKKAMDMSPTEYRAQNGIVHQIS